MLTIIQDFFAQAHKYGFDEIRIANLSDFPDSIVNSSALPSARGKLIMLAMAYSPFQADINKPYIDAYYPCSQLAYMGANQLSASLNEQGFYSTTQFSIRLKPAAVHIGLGAYGRNGLVANKESGSYMALQALLTDAPLNGKPLAAFDERSVFDLDDQCTGCSACITACPTGALDGTGSVDTSKCLRAMMLNGEPVPHQYRLQMSNRVLGCDICQRHCPRNFSIKKQPVPDLLKNAIAIELLLNADTSGLKPIIGSNFARPMRIQAQALLVAANIKAVEHLEKTIELTRHSSPLVRDHALWAAKKLELLC